MFAPKKTKKKNHHKLNQETNAFPAITPSVSDQLMLEYYGAI